MKSGKGNNNKIYGSSIPFLLGYELLRVSRNHVFTQQFERKKGWKTPPRKKEGEKKKNGLKKKIILIGPSFWCPFKNFRVPPLLPSPLYPESCASLQEISEFFDRKSFVLTPDHTVISHSEDRSGASRTKHDTKLSIYLFFFLKPTLKFYKMQVLTRVFVEGLSSPDV